MNNDELRREIKKRRNSVPIHDRISVSKALWERFFLLPEYHAARTILTYLSFQSEVDTLAVLPRLLAEKKVIVPYCKSETELGLAHITSIEQCVVGAFGILEPCAMVQNTCSIEELDLVIVPGVAFDSTGGRVGMGRGYYDRFLAKLTKKIPLISLAYECQRVENIPQQPWDVAVNSVLFG